MMRRRMPCPTGSKISSYSNCVIADLTVSLPNWSCVTSQLSLGIVSVHFRLLIFSLSNDPPIVRTLSEYTNFHGFNMV
jgi:hypothetical protein